MTRKHTYIVVTPLSRFQHLAKYLDLFEREGVRWDMLLDEGAPALNTARYPNVRCCYFPKKEPFWRAFNGHLTDYIRTVPIEPDSRYIILADDDWLEPGFFDKLDSVDGQFLLCSMTRGQRSPPGGHGHGTSTLIPAPQNITVGSVSIEQMIITGRLFSTLHFEDVLHADGLAIMELSKRVQPVFVPEAVVQFNRLEPGRWDTMP